MTKTEHMDEILFQHGLILKLGCARHVADSLWRCLFQQQGPVLAGCIRAEHNYRGDV